MQVNPVVVICIPLQGDWILVVLYFDPIRVLDSFAL